MPAPRRWLLTVATLALFTVWSNSFVAIGYLLGSDRAAARFDWAGLTSARFVPAGVLCVGYCVLFERRAASELLRGRWRRLLLCGALAVPCYNFALYFGQQRGVPASIASLTTALLPLFVLLLAALFLGERLTGRRVGGLLVAAAGMIVVASARPGEVATAYPLLLAIVALAPLSWSLYSVLSKPVAAAGSPVVWSYLATAAGSLMVLPLLPVGDLRRLPVAGWSALLYLAVPCTVVGFAVWTWLLRHLPASTVGFAVFLNPPLTAISKSTLSALFPATFVFRVEPLEWLGGAVALAGLALAVAPLRWRRRPVVSAAQGLEAP